MENRQSKRIKLTDSYQESFDEAKQILLKHCSSINKDESSFNSYSFFNQGSHNILEELNNNTKLDNKYLEFMSRNTFPLKIKFMYLCIGNENSEIQLGQFVLIKLNEIIEKYKNYTYFFDIGIKYYGMGHVMLLSMVKNTGELFFRTDGGSNGYDREFKFLKFEHLNPLDSNYSSKIVSVKTALSIITSDKLNNVFEDMNFFNKLFIK